MARRRQTQDVVLGNDQDGGAHACAKRRGAQAAKLVGPPRGATRAFAHEGVVIRSPRHRRHFYQTDADGGQGSWDQPGRPHIR